MSTAGLGDLRRRAHSPALGAAAAQVTPAAVLAVALALRLSDLSRVRPDPFYDAAVRSMGLSWHNLLFGALEPGGRVAIDKPPLALWLQVAATKALGFTTATLLLPEALAGVAAVALVYVLAQRVWGRAEALASAAALAVLPVAVLTARSDTMDALTSALTLLAAVALVRAARTGGRWPLVGAGVAIGLAFDVKLFQALIPVPALAVLFIAASALPLGERLSRLVLVGAVAAAVGMAWLAVVSTAPGREQPWAFGSSNGSALSATFGYNGVDRLRGHTRPVAPVAGHHTGAAVARRAGALARVPDPPGPARLLGSGGDLGRRLGWMLVPALMAGGLALLVNFSHMSRLARAGALAAGVWLLTGLVLFSWLPGLQVRYLDAFTPAVAAALGGGVVALARRAGGTWAAVPAMALLLAVPAQASVQVVRSGASDSGHIGAMSVREVRLLSAFLRRRSAGERYELATATAVKAAPLIERDARPVLVIDTLAARPLTSLRDLLGAVRRGDVRYVLMGDSCGPRSAREVGGCGRVARWVRVHGTDVSRPAGLRTRGTLYVVAPRTARRALARMARDRRRARSRRSHRALRHRAYRRHPDAGAAAVHPHRR